MSFICSRRSLQYPVHRPVAGGAYPTQAEQMSLRRVIAGSGPMPEEAAHEIVPCARITGKTDFASGVGPL
jgi:hypothetical protein